MDILASIQRPARRRTFSVIWRWTRNVAQRETFPFHRRISQECQPPLPCATCHLGPRLPLNLISSREIKASSSPLKYLSPLSFISQSPLLLLLAPSSHGFPHSLQQATLTPSTQPFLQQAMAPKLPMCGYAAEMFMVARSHYCAVWPHFHEARCRC